MSDVTKLLSHAAGGDPHSLNHLYNQVYAELRAMAVRKMSDERPGHTLQPTALVHEAYLRLGGSERFKFENRAHFFASAAEAMRRILVDSARPAAALLSAARHGRSKRTLELPEAEGGPSLAFSLGSQRLAAGSGHIWSARTWESVRQKIH